MNSFDYPLSSRFDETDCFCVFDNVFVPWESVYIYRNLQICWDQWWKTPAHLYGNHQAQCRYAVKLRFMLGLAKRMNEMTGNEGHQAVQVEMGELASIVISGRDTCCSPRRRWRRSMPTACCGRCRPRSIR